MATTTTLSSVGVSNPINLDWRGGKPVTCVVTIGSSTMTADYTLEFTVDDLQLDSTPTWTGISSAIGSSITHFSSATFAAGITMTFLNPIAGLRISSTAISSSSITMKTLQGVGW